MTQGKLSLLYQLPQGHCGKAEWMLVGHIDLIDKQELNRKTLIRVAQLLPLHLERGVNGVYSLRNGIAIVHLEKLSTCRATIDLEEDVVVCTETARRVGQIACRDLQGDIHIGFFH